MKVKWTRIEIDELNPTNRFTSLKAAMDKGYFSFTTLKYNNFINDRADTTNMEVGYCYSGISNSYIQVFNHSEAEKLYKNKKLRFK